ncbi:patatin-like phospholipase family protein [Robertkochia flava]|uniref:patatin-like phospholipase family protein n=1 Tax=Robertkochia flava TaxID=3447986 RepID=UPI001CCB3A8C|nr:patatin-like phospholipase family protein [Robertkochia marina]
MSAKQAKPYKYGFVLGGGGARGFAHLGAIKALKERGIEPDIISGVSAGAVAGAFIAAGKTPEETHEAVKALSMMDLTNFQMPKTGLFNLDKLGALLQSKLGKIDLKELKIPMIVGATDILNARVTYFREGDLSEIVQASASIPVLFSPVKIDDLYYADGGVFSNIPLAPLKSCCEYTIVINISPMDKIKELGNIANIAARTFQLSVNGQNSTIKSQCDIYIEPPELSSFPIFDTQKADELFEIGYSHALNMELNLKDTSGSSWWKKFTGWLDK